MKTRKSGNLFWLPIILAAIAILALAVVLRSEFKGRKPEPVQLSEQQEETASPVTMYAIDDTDILRSPDASADAMRTLYYRQSITVVGERGAYYQVQAENIEEGYVEKAALTDEAPQRVNESDRHWEYSREGLEIEITRYDRKEEELVYWVANIYTENPEEDINTMWSGGDYSGSVETKRRTSQMAEEADAIFAVNGDSAGFRGNGAEFENPIIIRNGEIYHEDDRNIGEMCALYKNGRLRIFSPGELGSASEMVQDGVTDVWWFDTPLIKNGEIPQGLIEQEDCFEAAPYTAIGQKDENHFLFIVVDGRGSNGSFGVTYTGMARLMKEYGAVTAYELDGGGSSTIWFDGMVLNEPSDGVERAISDMIYVRK